MKEPKLTIDPNKFEGLEDEVDWNFDESFLKPTEMFKETNPELAKVLDAHKKPAKKD